QSRRAAARDYEAIPCRFTNDARPKFQFIQFIWGRCAGFDARFDKLEPAPVEKRIAAGEGSESAQPVENLRRRHRPIDLSVFASEERGQRSACVVLRFRRNFATLEPAQSLDQRLRS